MSVDVDEVHRLPAVAEDQRRLPVDDPLHPADQHLGVEAVHVHPRAVDVEVAQRDVVEPVHRVEAAQHALVERLGRAVEGVVVVGVVPLGRSGTARPGRRPRPTRRRSPCRRRASTAASSTLNVPSTSTSSASRGSSAHWVIRIAAWWKTRSLPRVTSWTRSRSRMSPSTSVTRPRGQRLVEVGPATADEVVEHDDLRRRRRPAAGRRSCEPIVPAPPVTRTSAPCSVVMRPSRATARRRSSRRPGHLPLARLRPPPRERRAPAAPPSRRCGRLARSGSLVANSATIAPSASRSGSAGAPCRPSR